MKLVAKHTIMHDGKTYQPGELLDVKKAADAERLVALGAALSADKPEADSAPADPAPADPPAA